MAIRKCILCGAVHTAGDAHVWQGPLDPIVALPWLFRTAEREVLTLPKRRGRPPKVPHV